MATRPRRVTPRGVARASAQVEREADQRRGSARQRGYDSRWDKARAGYLRSHPLCAYCEAGAFGPARTTAATLVDHVIPHDGDRGIFWFVPWWAACCAPCHNGPKQVAERKGRGELAKLLALLGRPLTRGSDDEDHDL